MLVQAAICNCGKARKIAVSETTFDRETSREFAKLMEHGFKITNPTLDEAREMNLCFKGLHKY